MKNKLALAVLSAGFLSLSGCSKTASGPAVIGAGATVKLNYTLTVENKVVDASAGRGPLTYVQGSGQIIPGLEEQLVGLKAGDKKQVVVSPEKGYGIIDPKAFTKVPRKAFKDTSKMKVGSVVSGQKGGQQFQAVISAIGPTEITLDLNHPLAGKTLNFNIEVLDVQPAKS
jgi:FKBP-type peptidyl-prolyl cis-trans isomerase SlyD